MKKHIEKGDNHSSTESNPKAQAEGEIFKCEFKIGHDNVKNVPILCGRTFTKKWEYNIHIKKTSLLAHGKAKGKTLKLGGSAPASFPCKYCDQWFKTSKELKDHEVTHSEQMMQEKLKYREENFKCGFLIDIDAITGDEIIC